MFVADEPCGFADRLYGSGWLDCEKWLARQVTLRVHVAPQDFAHAGSDTFTFFRVRETTPEEVRDPEQRGKW